MRYLIAFIVPPLGVLLCGKLGQAIVNGLVWAISIALAIVSAGFLGILALAPIIHAFAVIGGHNADKRAARQARQFARASQGGR